MFLNSVVLTSADHTISPQQLIAAMKHTPYVDFGILFSPKRPQTRYPTKEWLQELMGLWQASAQDLKSSLYAHICSTWVTCLFQEDASEFFTDNAICHHNTLSFFAFKGFQINLGKRTINQNKIEMLLKNIRHYGLENREWIIQVQVKRQNALVEALRNAGIKASPLYDKSGGKGIEPKTWTEPQLDGYVGYAGGQNPNNWFMTAQTISAFPNNQPFWLDMETGLRDENDTFNMRDVNQILEDVKVMEANGLFQRSA